MRCVITAGPTYEGLDEVRRLTNFSTGRLGSELARFLESKGHEVQLFLGYYATWRAEAASERTLTFTTTADLRDQLRQLASDAKVDAVFHAAAVSDFCFGKIWTRQPDGELLEIKSSKISTQSGTLLAELTPTPKIIGELRGWFPAAWVVGWKYELDGDRDSALRRAERQMRECKTDACVVNGRAYGDGFGVAIGKGKCAHCSRREELFEALERLTV